MSGIGGPLRLVSWMGVQIRLGFGIARGGFDLFEYPHVRGSSGL
jgi:hypothetical protein